MRVEQARIQGEGPKKNPGSAPAVELGKLGGPETKVIKILTCLYCVRTHHIIF